MPDRVFWGGMSYYLLSLGLIAHTCFWGAGVSWLILPQAFRRCWWLLMPVAGLALQSAVVWFGAHAGLSGTDHYAWWSELVPAALLALAMRGILGNTRGAGRSLRRAGGPLAVLGVATAWMLISPLTVPGRGVYPASLGSCDAADYAAGGRIFQEFAREDRIGFLDQPDVTTVGSSPYFFDVWLRLNHFTPAAIIAHNATIFDVEAYRVIAVLGPVLVLLALPAMWLVARGLVGLRGGWLLAVTALFAFSPINAYAVHHAAFGQIFAAQGIAILTLGVVWTYRAARAGRPAFAFLPLLVASVWLLAGSYNFILVICLAAAGAWLALRFLAQRDARTLGRVLLVVAAAFWFCWVIFWNRFDGLIERFALFEQYDFGWRVPVLTPEAWVGVVRDESLSAFGQPVRYALGCLIVLAWIAAMAVLLRRSQVSRASVLFALVAPVAAGWLLLALESRERANASYDAYKILSVFLPGLIAGLCGWAGLARVGLHFRRGAAVFVAVLLVASVAAGLEFRSRMSQPPLRLDRVVTELVQLESNPAVQSVNLLIDDFWSRLWANALLLRKPQYFAVHTYEGRLNTELRGEWDLSDSLLRGVPREEENFISVNGRFHAARRGAGGRLVPRFGATGWHQLEGRGVERWRWSAAAAEISVDNPSDETVDVRVDLRVRAASAREVVATLDGAAVGRWQLGNEMTTVQTDTFALPPGVSVLKFGSGTAPVTVAGDPRQLSFALYAAEFRALPAGTGQPVASEDN